MKPRQRNGNGSASGGAGLQQAPARAGAGMRVVERPPARVAAPRRRAEQDALATVISRRSAEILQDWDRAAGKPAKPGRRRDAQQVPGDGAGILSGIVSALLHGLPHPPDGGGPLFDQDDGLSPAERHADARRADGYTLDMLVADYGALRSSILRACGAAALRDAGQLATLNEAVDQALTRSARRYELQARMATDLFLGILAHDIRNPLGTILNRLELAVLTRQLPAAGAMPIINAARRIKGIIEQTVDFTRLQSFGALPVVRKEGDLGLLMAKVVEETQARHAATIIRLEATGDLWGAWDAGRLSQVLSNLLGNAMIYGARNAPVTVRIRDDGEEVCVSVHNEGIPIPPGELDDLFEPLFRGSGGLAERRARDGLGLGLFICREIAHAHGGSIRVESHATAGTTFTFNVPREPRPAPGA